MVKWYAPILNSLPRDYKFLLGERIVENTIIVRNPLILIMTQAIASLESARIEGISIEGASIHWCQLKLKTLEVWGAREAGGVR